MWTIWPIVYGMYPRIVSTGYRPGYAREATESQFCQQSCRNVSYVVPKSIPTLILLWCRPEVLRDVREEFLDLELTEVNLKDC